MTNTKNKKKELSNIDIILYAMFLLNGTTKKIHTEDITLKCYELASSRFSWIRHPNYPNLEPVRRPLITARSKELVLGRHGRTKENQIADGWIFSPKGVDWIEKNKKRIQSLLGSREQLVNRNRREIDKKINELKGSVAFKKFLKNKTCTGIERYEFTDFLNASLDTPVVILHERMDKIRAIAATAKRKELIEFVDKAEQYFSKFLKRKL